MTTPRQKTKVLQSRGGVEVVEPPTDTLRPFRSVLANQQLLPVAECAELLEAEPDLYCIRSL